MEIEISYGIIIEDCLQLLKDRTHSTSEAFSGVCVSRKSFLKKCWEYSRLSHANIAEFLELFLRFALINASKKAGKLFVSCRRG